jgi:hypothetical protein
MKQLRKTGTVVVTLFAMSLVAGMLLNPPNASAQAPVVVYMVGKVLKPAEKGEVNTYSFDLKQKTLRFRVDQGVTPDFAMEDTTIYDILGALVKPSLKVIGKKQVIQPLLQSGVEGKYFYIEGDLYVESQLLVVTKVQEVGKRRDEGVNVKGGENMQGHGM